VTIPLDHEETVTLQFLPDLFNENNWICLVDKVFELAFLLLIVAFLICNLLVCWNVYSFFPWAGIWT
jgi:hypothetical protein